MTVPIALFAVLYGVGGSVSSFTGNEHLLFNILEYARPNTLLANGGMVAVASLTLLLSFLLSKRLYANCEF